MLDKRTVSFAKQSIANLIKKRPYCVSFETTYVCNARCKHCHLHNIKDKKLATPEELGKICREIKPIVVQVSGGEPLLRKEVNEIIKQLSRPGKPPYLIMTTNGSLLTEKRYHELVDLGIDEFSISLDYPDDRHDEFRQIPGLFAHLDSLMKSLNYLEDKKITVSCVIQNDNFREILKVAEVARNWGINANFSTYTWLRTHNRDYAIPKESIPEFKQLIEELIDYKNTYNCVRTSDYVLRNIPRFFEDEEIPNCTGGNKFAVINPDGTFSPCGLIIKNYKNLDEMHHQFCRTNECGECYTSSRANSEKPIWYLIKDNIDSIKRNRNGKYKSC